MDNTAIFKLYPVRTVPFFALGILFCAGGGTSAFVMVIIAALLCIVVSAAQKKLFASAVALLVGMLSISGYNTFVRQPLLDAAGTTQTLECRVTEAVDYKAYWLYSCSTVISGRSCSISFFGGEAFAVGDIITADIQLDELDRAYEAQRKYLSASIKEIHSVYHPDFDFQRGLYDYRSKLCEDIQFGVAHGGGQLVGGLIFGDTSQFSTELTIAAKLCGIMHFTSVSGSHFVIIMTVLLELMGKKRPRTRALLAIAYIPLAVLFFGAEPTVMRAGIMLMLNYCGDLFSRKTQSLNSLCVAIFLMTVFSPNVMLDSGFQMSVLGVFGVSVLGGRCSSLLNAYTIKLPTVLRILVDAVITSSCAVICIAPVSIYCFGGISLIGAVVTVMLTPIFTVVLGLGVVFAATELDILLVPMDFLLNCTYNFIVGIGKNPAWWLAFEHDSAVPLAIVAVVGLSVAVILPKTQLNKGLLTAAAATALSLALCISSSLTRSKIDFVSNGKSGAAVVCSGGTASLVICGSGSNFADELSDCLMRNGIVKIDRIIVPELDYQGAVSVSNLGNLYPIGGVYTEQTLDIITDRCDCDNINICDCAVVDIDGISIACTHSDNDKCAADIVMYSGYRKSAPCADVGIALYVSSRITDGKLPEGGINIYDTEFEISLEK